MEIYTLKQTINNKEYIFIVIAYEKTVYKQRYNAQWFENKRILGNRDYDIFESNPLDVMKKLVQGKVNECNNVAKVYVKTHRQRKDINELTLDSTERKYSKLRDEYIKVMNELDINLINKIEL